MMGILEAEMMEEGIRFEEIKEEKKEEKKVNYWCVMVCAKK